MLKPRYESNWIYWLFILYISISIVLAKGISDCDVDDLECLEDYTTTTTSFVTPSSFSFGEPSSTVTATSTDILSDFHEAKLVKPKPHNPNIPNRPNMSNPVPPDQSVQDNVNQDQDVGSSINESINEEKQLSALSNVEAGILSACGVLVVAGIAVGIFVWKNTTRRRNLRRNHDMPMVDIENGDNDDDRGNTKETLGALNGKEIYGTSLSQSKDGKLQATITLPPTQQNDDFFSNWQRRNQQDHDTTNFEIEPKQKLHDVEIISENKTTTTTVLPSLDDDTSEHVIIEQTVTKKVIDQVLLENDIKVENNDAMFAEPPSIEANTTTRRPSALDPAYDPTALTYPLQKFLQTPTLYTSSPMQISIHLGSDDEDDDEEKNNKIYQPKQATHTETSPQVVGESSVDNKGVMGTPLSQHLNKLLRYPSTDRQRMISSSSSKMVEIDLQDNTPNQDIPIHASPRLNHVLGKFTKEPLPIFDKQTEITQNYLEKGKGPAQLFIDDYKKKYLEEHGKPFMSPLDLPDDQFVPLQDAVGPPLISRAQVLADPIRRLGEDEIALWEQSCKKKKNLKRLDNNEMWDEQLLRQQVEQCDRKHIARFYYGVGDATVPTQQQEEA